MIEPVVSTHVLPNGLTVVEIDLPHFQGITNLLVIRSGSRYETPANHGVAHFLEHLVFKGTKSYPTSRLIAEAIEGVGGYFNAWTSYDSTAYWNIVPAKFLALGLQVPLELAFQPLLRSEDLERERGVIIEEIRRINDDPASLIGDISQEMTFGAHPLGRSVIGTEQSIGALTIKDVRDYQKTHYNPGQAYMIVAGNIGALNVKEQVWQQVQAIKKQSVSQFESFEGLTTKGVKVVNRPTDQAHFVLSLCDSSFALTSPDRFTAVLLNTVLGSGMSSRLFLNIREEKGLAYSIHSGLSLYEDTGEISIYGGVTTGKVGEALAAVDEELARLAKEPVGLAELTKVKNLLVGSFELSADRPLDLASWYGISWLLGMKEICAQAKAAIEVVTVEQIQKLA